MSIPKAFEGLLSTDTGKGSVSPERLQLMGKQASNRYLEDGIPLNESVTKLAAEIHDINAEHIKRVCEFANRYTFQAEFEKQAGSDHRCVNFPVADPSDVVKELNTGPRPTTVSPTDVAFRQNIEDREEGSLADVFGVKIAEEVEIEKQAMSPRNVVLASGVALGLPAVALGAAALRDRAKAEIEQSQDKDQIQTLIQQAESELQTAKSKTAYPMSNPHRPLLETLGRVSDWRDNFQSQSRGLGAAQDQAVVDVLHDVKTASLGNSADEVVAVMYRALGGNKVKLASLLRGLVPQLEKDEEFCFGDTSEKLASLVLRDVNEESPLFQSVRYLDQVTTMKDDTDAMLGQLQEAKNKLGSFVRENGFLT